MIDIIRPTRFFAAYLWYATLKNDGERKRPYHKGRNKIKLVKHPKHTECSTNFNLSDCKTYAVKSANDQIKYNDENYKYERTDGCNS